MLIPAEIGEYVSHPTIQKLVNDSKDTPARSTSPLLHLRASEVTDELIHMLHDQAVASDRIEFSLAMRALINTREGRNVVIPNEYAAVEIMQSYLDRDIIDGWVYTESISYECRSPYRVDRISLDNRDYSVMYIYCSRYEVTKHQVVSEQQQFKYIRRGSPEEILRSHSLLKETRGLRQEYDQWLNRYRKCATSKSKQVIVDGSVAKKGSEDGSSKRMNVSKKKHAFDISFTNAELEVMKSNEDLYYEGLGKVCISTDQEFGVPNEIPFSLNVPVVDLSSGQKLWSHINKIKQYRYDKDAKSTIILSPQQKNIVDILTSPQKSSGRPIQGKKQGTVVLCKGDSGTGKTMTAEVVAESLKKPLYRVSPTRIIDGSVGSTMDFIERQRKKWNAIILIDECEVILGKRGQNFEKDRITVEMLRVLEDFEGMIFLTTSRPDELDEAIFSRCSVVINYSLPDYENSKRLWIFFGDQLKEGLIDDAMARALAEKYKGLPPREIKQMVKMAYWSHEVSKVDFTIDLIAETSVFREA